MDERRPVLEAETREDAAEWVQNHLGFEPDEMQKVVLSTKGKRGILNCSRLWGKSLIASAKAVHHAWTEPESVTLVVSPSERQSRLFVRKVKRHVEMLGIRPKGDGDNAISVLFPNGSVIVGLPGNEATTRGFAASLLLIDEAAKVSDELYTAIRPALATTDGALWLMSTPYGKRGFFYNAWAKGGDKWVRIRGPATECPRIAANFLDGERSDMSEREFRQEYMCEFAAREDSAFDPDLIDQALNDGVEPLEF